MAMSKDATLASAPSEETPPTDVTSSGASARGPCLPMAADVKKTGGCKTHTVEHSDSDGPTVRIGGTPNQRMGAGLDPLVAAPRHYRIDPMRPTSPRTTPPDARDIGPPSKGRRAYPKLVGTLLAMVAAAPATLAVRAFRGTSSSPKTMGRVLILLAMLSTASGWKLPKSVAPGTTITGESPITGEVDGARDRRRLVASSCNAAWCVRPPRPCSPPLRKLAAAFLSAAQRTIQTAITMTVVDAIAIVDAILVFLYAIVLGFAVVATTLVIAIPATTATIVPFTQQDIPLATAAVP